MRHSLFLLLLSGIALAADPESFQVSDSEGHLVSTGFRTQREDGNYLRTGHWVFFNSNGTKKEEGDFVNDASDGEWTEYGSRLDESRVRVPYKRAIHTYKNGVLIYIKNLGAESGAVTSEGPYKDGARHSYQLGLWRYYYKNGDISSLVQYGDRGIRVSWSFITHDGKVLAQFPGDQPNTDDAFLAASHLVNGK